MSFPGGVFSVQESSILSNAEVQQGRSASAMVDRRGEQLARWGRRGVALLGRVPAGVWRFCVKLLLVLWLAYTLGGLVWMLVPAPEVRAAHVAPNALNSEPATSGQANVDIEQLAGLSIFGEPPEGEADGSLSDNEPSGAPGVEEQAVDTELNLVLRGVMGSSEQGAARAIIAEGDSQAIYAPGDELPVSGSVTLEKVLPLRVILDNAGRYESLWLYSGDDWNDDLASSQLAEERPGRSWEGDPGTLRESRASPSGDRSQEQAQEQESNEPDESEQQMQETARDVAERVGAESLSDVVSMSIHREDGRVAGYRIRPGRNREAFESLGLQGGDIVKAVNGTALDNPQRVMEIYRNMGDARSASLLIERDGQEVTVDIDLE